MFRASGDALAEDSPETMDKYDQITRDVIKRLIPGIDGLGVRQARIGAQTCGLGMYDAGTLSRCAPLAAAIMTALILDDMATDMERAGLIRKGDFDTLRRKRTENLKGNTYKASRPATKYVH